MLHESILTKKARTMADEIDTERTKRCSTERDELEARIERLRQVAESMKDREAATQLLMQILALEVELLV
jgi:hypothetical protein